MSTRQRYGRRASHASPAAPAAQKPDKKASQPGEWLSVLKTTPFSNHTRIRELIGKLSINGQDLYADFVFGYPESQKGGVSLG